MQLGSLSPDLHSFPHILLDVFLSIISKMAQNDPKEDLFTKHNPAGEAGLMLVGILLCSFCFYLCDESYERLYKRHYLFFRSIDEAIIVTPFT